MGMFRSGAGIGPGVLCAIPGRSPWNMPSRGHTKRFTITGVTRDSTGAALASCKVQCFTIYGLFIGETSSDGGGNFTIDTGNNAGPYFLVSFKAGGPDVMGATDNNLQAT